MEGDSPMFWSDIFPSLRVMPKAGVAISIIQRKDISGLKFVCYRKLRKLYWLTTARKRALFSFQAKQGITVFFITFLSSANRLLLDNLLYPVMISILVCAQPSSCPSSRTLLKYRPGMTSTA